MAEAGYHPWFEPLWRRLLILGVCLAWTIFEAVHDLSSLWFWVATAVTAWGVWELFLSGRYGRSPPAA
jgi:hypothetical protein